MTLDRVVVSGLEGCRKSSKTFSELEKKASREFPLLVGIKNYKLMREQMLNWSKQFGIPLREFAICGFSKNYEPAREVYTNKEYPFQIGDSVRVVFTSQAILQRNRHWDFINDTTKKPVEYSNIIVDEFEFSSGIIPALEYQLERCLVEKEKVQDLLLKWVRSNYTIQDYYNVLIKTKEHDKGFTVAHWIQSSRAPIFFLTSEVLSTKVLKSIGFTEKEIGDKDLEKGFKDCVIYTQEMKDLTSDFIGEMNKELVWNRLDYDMIISDNIVSYYDSNKEEDLDILVVTHSGSRGSNSYRDKKILTVLSHIPKAIIAEIQSLLNDMGEDVSYEEVSQLYYRDRLCQAVGRTLGYRGGKESYLLVHSDLYNQLIKLDSIPYTLEKKELLSEVGNVEEILSRVKELKEERRKLKHRKREVDFSVLDSFFVKDSKSVLKVADVRDYLEKHKILNKSGTVLPVTKVAKYFGCTTYSTRVKGVSTRMIRGVKKIH